MPGTAIELVDLFDRQKIVLLRNCEKPLRDQHQFKVPQVEPGPEMFGTLVKDICQVDLKVNIFISTEQRVRKYTSKPAFVRVYARTVLVINRYCILVAGVAFEC
jgi:hypothetical protein